MQDRGGVTAAGPGAGSVGRSRHVRHAFQAAVNGDLFLGGLLSHFLSDLLNSLLSGGLRHVFLSESRDREEGEAHDECQQECQNTFVFQKNTSFARN